MKKIITFLILFIFAFYNSFAQHCFSTATYINTGTNLGPVTTADFNGDGNVDIITTHPSSTNLSLSLGNGAGVFTAPTNIAIGVTQTAIINADFNTDGKIDIAIATESANNISILLGDGLGSFATATSFAVGTFPRNIISADFNGDGKIDLATNNRGSNNISVLLGNGTGSFGTATNFTVGNSPWSMTSADFNGDGNIDLATSNTSSGDVSVLLGNGTGSFGAATNITIIGGGFISIISADFNGDGKIDLVTGGSTIISLLLGNGTGSFGTATKLNVPNNVLYNITSADLNNDGNMDLVAASSANNVIIITGNGSGGFVTDSLSCVAPIYITSADVTGDGKKDIIASTNANAYLATFINKGFTINLTATNPTCVLGGGPPQWGNGSITATVTGGLSTPLITWNTMFPQSGSTASNLSSGTYTVTVSDNNTCSNTATITLLGPAPLSSSITNTNVTCYGGNNGMATAFAIGGIPPYTYSWDTSPVQTSATINNLTAGSYSVTVSDSIGCTAFSTGVTINEPAPLSLYWETTGSNPNTKCSGACNGAQNVSAFGGTAPYAFQWDLLAHNQTTQIATQLCQGNYFLTITDTMGCTVTDSITVGFNSIVHPEIFLTNLAAVDQLSVSPSFTAYYSYNLPPSINPPVSNPRNFVDAGKKARFKVECSNQKMNGQSVVSGICKVRSNSPYITVTDSSSILNNIGWNNKTWSADEFEIDIKANTPAGSNAYIDFVVQENGQDYATTCIAIPISPLVYSPTTPLTIDDDNNPDSQGNDNEICDPNEIIEFYPWLNNISTLNAEYVRGRFENLDNHSFINIWNNVAGAGVGVTVYNAGWWNYAFNQPAIINAGAVNTTPEYDFVFNYNTATTVNNFKLYMVMAGGFKLFSGTALSLVQWSVPYTFNASGGASSVDDKLQSTNYLNAYPNPTTDLITIENKQPKLVLPYVILNSLGNQVLTGNLAGATTTVDINNLLPGIYLLQVGETKNQSFKLIKK